MRIHDRAVVFISAILLLAEFLPERAQRAGTRAPARAKADKQESRYFE
jgi:hypothetical protein